ncbi:hypothetical protein KIN20_014489 [Parelaphostrongylus tenuis]|uniref:Mos1 transposase HTH domain-containing protein n=1 Tax=Parelaphostrongylus tenuis TaxID=148309 RepID=A0AAD5QPC7_PARTN|nr:hypothetical protein KIN20_014489 [Parelaphostrongylus tenuis]
MERSWEQIRLLLKHEWRIGENANEAASKINGAWGDDTSAEMAAEKWFAKSKAGEKSLECQLLTDGPPEARLIFHAASLAFFSTLYPSSKRVCFNDSSILE